MSLGKKSALVKSRQKKSLMEHKSFWIGFSCLVFCFFLNNRVGMENVDQIAFLSAATKQTDPHMADRPPPHIPCIRVRTGTISQKKKKKNASPTLHFKRDQTILSSFKAPFLTQGKIQKKVSCTDGERVKEKQERQGRKKKHERLRIAWNSLLSYHPCWLSDLLSNCPGARPRERPAGTL